MTPDSFSDGGQFVETLRAVERGEQLLREGAVVVDVGGESSRPPGMTYGAGAASVSAEEEMRRVLPVVRALREKGARVSIDTVKAEVAREALAAGAAVVNDVSCGRSEALLEAVAGAEAELVLMHTRGRGECHGDNVRYGDVVQDVRDELLRALERAERYGVKRGRVWLDPGLGFAKTAEQSLRLLARTDALVATGQRVLVGPSRKSFIGELVRDPGGERPAAGQRLGGTAAAVTMAALLGAHAVRVHDVELTRQAVGLALRVREESP